jgi:hypothetical protein
MPRARPSFTAQRTLAQDDNQTAPLPDAALHLTSNPRPCYVQWLLHSHTRASVEGQAER